MIKKITLLISLYFLYSTFTFAAGCLKTMTFPPNLACGAGYTMCDAGSVILGTELPSQFGGQSFPSGISIMYAPYTNASGQYWECYDCNWAVECSLPFSGDVNVTANIASASWTITGPSVIVGSGTSQNTPASPAGTYTITWGAVSGYTTPASQTFTLVDLGTITFTGIYVTSCSWAQDIYDMAQKCPIPFTTLPSPLPACSISNVNSTYVGCSGFTQKVATCECVGTPPPPPPSCTWGWGSRTLIAVPSGTNSSTGCSVGTVDPTYACNSSRNGQTLTCVDFIPDAFNYTCACRVGTPAPTINLWFSQ